MTDEMRLDGMGIAPGVLETIAVQAACQIEGVDSVDDGQGLAGLVAKGQGKPKGVEVELRDDGGLDVALHVALKHGKPLHEVARKVQRAVASALEGMTDQPVKTVDVFVDDVVFGE